MLILIIHAGWHLLAFLIAYYNSREHHLGSPFYYKSLINRFCHTTRFPYYFYMLADSNRVPQPVDLNLKNYLDNRRSYNALLDFLNGKYVKPEDRSNEIYPFWRQLGLGNAQENIYQNLANLDPVRWARHFLYENISVALDKFFYPFHVNKTLQINHYVHKTDLCRALIKILRFRFSGFSPYPYEYDKAGSVRQELRELVIQSRHDTILDGRVVRLEDDTTIVKFMYKLEKPKPRKQTQADRLARIHNKGLKAHVLDQSMDNDGKTRQISKTSASQWQRRGQKPPKKHPDDESDEDFDTEGEELLEQARLFASWGSLGLEFDFADGEGHFCEEDGTVGNPINGSDSILELVGVENGSYSLAVQEKTEYSITKLVVRPPQQPGEVNTDPIYPDLLPPDEWKIQPRYQLFDTGFPGIVAFYEQGIEYELGTGLIRENLTYRDTISAMESISHSQSSGSTSTKDTNFSIWGIAYNDTDQQTLNSSQEKIYSCFPPGSVDCARFSLWPGQCLRFSSPIQSSTEGPFTVLLSNVDQTVGTLAALLGSTSNVNHPSGMLRRLELCCMWLHERNQQQGVPAARVDGISATLAVGKRRLVFSSNAAALTRQFGLTDEASNGLQLRSQEALLALESIDDSKSISMADVFAVAGLEPAEWIRKVLGEIFVEIVGLPEEDRDDPGRNGLWLSPSNGLEVVIRLQFRLLEIPTLSKLSEVLPKKLKLSSEYLVIAKRGAAYSPSGAEILFEPEVILQTSITIPAMNSTSHEERDVSAYIFLRENSVELRLVRHSARGSMKNLFKWIVDSFQTAGGFGKSVADIQTDMEKITNAGTSDVGVSKSKFDMAWRSFSIEFNKTSILEIQACFELEMEIGVPQGKKSGFSLDFNWTPRRWNVSSCFMPGGRQYIRGVDENMDPTWELCDWVPPLNPNREPRMSIFHIDPTGLLNETTVPSYLPTDINLSTLTISSEGVTFSAMLRSRNSTSSLGPSAQDVPTVPLTKSSLFVSTTYKTKKAGSASEFSLLISGTVDLPIMGQRDGNPTEVGLGRGNPTLNVTIEYKKGWSFAATARNICIGSLVSVFGGEVEQEDVKDILGHLVLDTLRLKYSHEGAKVSTLELFAVVVFKNYQFELSYKRSVENKDGGWTLRMEIPEKKSREEIKLSSILQWLLGDSAAESLPDFIAETSIDLGKTGFTMTLTNSRTKDGTSDFTLSVELNLGDLCVQFARLQSRPAGLKKGQAKPPAKMILRVAVKSLPRPPALPLVGQIDPLFSVDFRWVNADLLDKDITSLNDSKIFQKGKFLTDSDGDDDGSHAGKPVPKDKVAYGKGVSFMLLAGGVPVLSTKPKSTGKKKTTTDDPSGKPEQPKSATGDQTQPTEMRPFKKRANGLSFTNVGLDYDDTKQEVKIKFTARATLGPLDGELINFTMTVAMPRSDPRAEEGIQLSDWSKLDISLDLDGVALAMTGPNLAVAGFLQRVAENRDGREVMGYEGGIGLSIKPYAFTAFGTYKDILEADGTKLVSLMVYAMLQGPILKTPYVEVRGISGGFGIGSKLALPSVADVKNFPLLMDATPSAVDTFAKLRGSNEGPRYITEVNGGTWFAVGVLATACETVDVSAVVTLAMSPDVAEIGILGTAAARFPRDQPAEKALALIELDFAGKIDITNGFFCFEGQISQRSFLLSPDCHPTGGFVIAAWFGPSPQAGDWCISIGGWHPAYVAPAHYPREPPRLGISWRYSSKLSITGSAYAAVTPDALMGGAALNALFSVADVGADFDFRADFILQMHPLHYSTTVYVSASVWYELSAGPIRKKVSTSLGAELTLSGPPFAGTVVFDVAVTTIEVKFGEQQKTRPDALDLQAFVDVCLKKNKDNKENMEPQHILTLEAGGIPPTAAPSDTQQPDTPWMVRGPALSFTVLSRIPSSSIELLESTMPSWHSDRPILSRPMQLTGTSAGLAAPLTVKITRKGSGPNADAVAQNHFAFEPILEKVPASLWGAYDADSSKMLSGAAREATISHVMGVRIVPPRSTWSKKNPRIVPLAKLAPPIPTPARFADDSVRTKGHDARPRLKILGPRSEEEEFNRARRALLGSDQHRLSGPVLTPGEPGPVALSKHNERRAAILARWATCRGLTSMSPVAQDSAPANLVGKLASKAPRRYAAGLERFCHAPPRVAAG